MNTQGSYLERMARSLAKSPSALLEKVTAVIAEMLIIIIDRSGSMETPCGRVHRLAAAQDAVITLLNARQQRQANDTLAVIAFNHQAELVLPFTPCQGHRPEIDRAIRSITVEGSTNLKAPLILVSQILPSAGRVHVVLLSDGHGGNATRIARTLKKKGVIIETIGVADFPCEVDEIEMKAIASVLDGKVLYRFISDADELAEYFRTEVANRLVKRSKP